MLDYGNAAIVMPDLTRNAAPFHGKRNAIPLGAAVTGFGKENYFPNALPINQLWVKLAASVIGLLIVIETGLVVPENDSVPVPLQLVKL